MKHLRTLALAVAATALCSAAAFACGNDKTTAAAASSGNAKASACCATGKTASKVSATAASHGGACTAEMAAKCTPEMAAACAQMKGKTTATAASNAASCPYAGAAMAGCTSHGKTSATAASAASGSCSAHGKTSAMAAGSGCTTHGSASMAMHDCDACADMATCENELSAAGARSQVVPLKNGVMYVYTAESNDRVRAVQSAVARGNERARAVLAAGDKAKLCAGCRQMRGAMASGKLVREVVNVETGALTLVTSTDRAIVNRIHDLAGTEMAVRTTH